jgi:hypothetical protein
MAECFASSLDELELAIRQTDPSGFVFDIPEKIEKPDNPKAALKAFHDANKALDEAIESLEDI